MLNVIIVYWKGLGLILILCVLLLLYFETGPILSKFVICLTGNLKDDL